MTVNQLRNKLESKINSNKPIVAVYITLGYPSISESIKTMISIAERGADIIEIGVPFSDPVADGPIIQNSSRIALINGTEMDQVWVAVKKIKTLSNASPVIMTYCNLIIQYGLSKFVKNAINSGLEGIIIPDLPPEYMYEELKLLNPIYLVAPNTEMSRISKIISETGGFIYIISRLEVTGKIKKFDRRIKRIIEKIEMLDPSLPKLIGFGISKHDHFLSALKMGANGVIIGSAVIQAMQKGIEAANIKYNAILNH